MQGAGIYGGMAPDQVIAWQPGPARFPEVFGEPPAGCRCAWTHYPYYGGWHRTTTRPECPLHGDRADDRTPTDLPAKEG
jgi:hypothetical protein